MRTSATGSAQQSFVGQPLSFGIDEKQVAESFAAVVIDFDAYTLARASGRDVETARLWKAGKRAPNSASLINLARVIQEVHDWLNGEIESRKPRPPITSLEANRAYALLQQEAMEPGQTGVEARKLLAKLSRGGV